MPSSRGSSWPKDRTHVSYASCIGRQIFFNHCVTWTSAVKNPPAMQETQEAWVWSLDQENLEKEMATHSSILAWKILWTEVSGGPQSMGSQRVGHNWATKHAQGIRMRVSILPQTPLASKLPHNIEQNSVCWTVGPYWLSILNIAGYTCPFQTPNYPSLLSFPQQPKVLFLSLFLFSG